VTHGEAGELLAAYALDAVSDDERRELDAHLATCVGCAHELARFRAAASQLGQSEFPAPSGQWERIASAIGDRSGVVARPSRRRRRALGTGGAVAIAAAAAALVAFVLVDSDGGGDGGDVEAAARTAISAPGAQRVALETAGGERAMDVVVQRDGRGYVLDDSLAALPKGRIYQLWALTGGDPISIGVLGRDPGVHELDLPAGTTRLAVTREHAPGAVQPSNAAVASGVVA
jgi:anti-sigma factor RsiW